MTAAVLWRRLAALGITVSADDGDLELEGDLEALDEALIAEIRAAKPALLDWIAAREIRPRREAAADYPLSAQQQRLWFVQTLDPDSAAYNLPAAFRLSGALDVARLKAVLHRIMERHAALRTRFVAVDGLPRQVVLPPDAARITLDVTDLTGVPAQARLEEARRLAAAEAARPFDLSVAPLIRAALIRLGEGDHLLVITLHHIVADGWSIALLMREVALLWHGESLPALRLDYADYALWQNGPGAPVQDEALDWWKAALADLPPVSTFPADFARPALPSGQGGAVDLELAAPVVAGLRRLATQQGTTLFTLLLAGQGALLARYARQEDICIGSPVANRARAEVEGIFGFFVNMVALRCQPRPDLPLGDYLRAVRQQVEAAFAHQSAPFERVVEATGAARRLDQAPLFQTVLVLQNAAGQAVHLPGLEVAPFALPAAPPKFDLTVTAVELPEGGLSLQLAYDAGLFRPDTAARIGRNLTALLQAMAAADLSVPLGDLPILGIEEQALLTVTLARGPRSEGMADPVARLAALAAEAPDHPAIVCGAAGLSRQGLDLLARRFATALRARGIGPGDLVAIHAEAEPWRVAAMLAVLRCGAAYLPLEPSYPAERLAYMLEDAAPALVIGGRAAFAGGLPCLDPADVAGLPPDDSALLAAPAEAAAYVIYTSGSTGRPKGVVVPHRGLRNLCNWMAGYLSFGPDSRFVATMRFGFDGSVAETWPILAAGGTLVMTPQPVQDDPAHLLDWLADQQADACFLTTPLAELGMAGEQLDRAGMAVMTGGDRLRQRPAEGAGWVLHNNYGPTETTVIATAGAVAPGAGDDPAIGQPIGNTRIYLLDARLNPVPLGAVGELWIAGEGVAQGYLNQPGQTAAAFLPDPFGPPGARMYRSGDLARRRADGALHHLGRADAQISLRGYRIEPGEIEQALTRQPGVEQALVLAREGRLLAWVIAAEGAADPAALRRALARDLPEHMVPAAILPLERWPMTANGKIDRAALPQPEVQAGSFTPPQGETELWLAGIWQDLLGVAQVGREDNFFALGGHSLLTTQAASRIRAERGADLPLRLFFEAPTLADLAAALDERAVTGARGLPVLHPRAAGRDDLPLSFAQQRLWFLDQLEPGNPFYNIPGALRLQGRLEHGLLQQTLDRLIARHETLRTHFPTVQGVPRQVVQPRLDLPLRVTDLSAHDAATRDRLARDLVAADARAPFDLTTGPLLRAHLVVLAPEDHLLLVNLHHIIADGWSMGVLMREVAAIYAALQAGEGTDPLPPLPVQYGDFALWQRDWLSGEELARQEGYWLARLADLPATPLSLPLDHPRPAAQSHRGATHSFDIGAGLAARLKALASGQGATLFMVLNAVYAVLLARYSGQTDIPVGSPIANRRSAQVEGMIGFFVNTIVLRHAVEPGQSFAGFLSQVRRTALEAFDHQDLPFEQLIDLLNPERSLAHAPVFQVSFALQNAPAAAADLPGLRLLSVEAEAVTAKFDLTLTGFETGAGLHFDCEYATDLFDAATIERFCHDYAALLGAVVDAPDTALHALPLVTAEDRTRLAGWNDTAAPMPAESALAAFEAQAQARPDAVALSWNDQDLTYAALDRRANRLAHALIAAGLRPGDAVGLGCGRGPDHIVAMLAANKAGAVYVMLPLDAPDERIGFILRDTGMRHVIGRPEPRWGDAIVIAPETEGQPGTPPAVARPDRAYIVYTSGTTGAPKGSINTHSGLANMSRWYADLCDLRPGTAVSVVANIAFDGILPEIWPALMVGGRLVLVPDEVLRDAWALADHLARARVEVLYLPMGYLETLAATGFDWPQSLTRVVAGGDRMKRYVLPPERGLPLINIYGPSETQSISTAETVLPGHDGPITIGRPIPNVRIHILDAMLNDLPPGAVGETCIAGAGVGEGYLARPGLTAERFVPDPSGPPGARMYRSGDMGRFLPDGRIDYLGRGDGQLKIRGFRVETGEVEAALLAQPGIAEALVLAKPDPVAGARLLAWVVPEAESRESTHWESTFDQIYAEEAADETPADSGFDITGWTDSYSGAAIPAPEMAEWLEETIARISGLSPRHVLEIGCGTGMILHRIAGQAETYTGTDLSQTVLTRLARSLPRDHAVRLLHAPADDWSQLGDRRFDTVILNSVAQYFPGLAYLSDWLAGAVARVETGTIFLGDLRNFALAEAFQTSVALHHAGASATVADLRQDVARRLAAEPELLVDPVWFHAFAASQPRICRVDVLPKEGAARNELMRFRYDVLLHIGPVTAQAPEDWQPAPLPEALPDLLAAAAPRLALRDLPFAPPAGPLASARLLHELPDAAPASAVRVPEPAGFDARSLRDLAAAHGYHLDLGLASGTGHVHAVFRRRDASPAHWPSLWSKPPRLSPRLANTPHIPERDTTLSRGLTEALGQSLPSYMLPSSIMVLSGFPLSLNGKVDRRALPLPVVQGGAVVVRAGVEAELAGLWAEVLGLSADRIGAGETFFALGGHSLLATQLIARVRRRWGIELSLRALFEHPTLEGLAPVVAAAIAGKDAVQGGGSLQDCGAPVLPDPAPRGPGPVPLSFAQQRLWFLDQLSPGDTAYNQPVALRLTGRLEPDALAQALTGLVARHEALRTVFATDQALPVQVILPPGPVDLPLEDLSDEVDPMAAAGARLAVLAAEPFDLARGPLLRARVIRLGPEDHLAALVLHHIVSDGWSLGVFLRELAALYEAALAGRAADLPPLPLQYGDYAAWQRAHLQGPELERQLAYWRSRLAGMPDRLALPTDRPRPAVQSHAGAVMPFDLPAGLTRALEALARRTGTSLHMVLVAVLSVLLARWSGQEDIAIGTPVAGRRHAALEGLIGFFVNTLVLRAGVDAAEPFSALLGRLREDALAAQAHQDLPFDQLVEALQPARDLSHAPLFQVMLALQNAPLGAMAFGGLRLEPAGVAVTATKFDLTFSLQEVPGSLQDLPGQGGLTGAIEYATDLFDAATIARLAAQFRHLAAACAAAPETRIGALPLMDAAERAAVVAGWAPAPPPAARAAEMVTGQLDTLVSAAAARHPDRIALRCEGTSLTYAALEARANRLAHRLVQLGVGPETRVGLCCERSFEMIVGLLAVLKAGGAYVPLDPEHPDDRLAYMLEDAAPVLVLAQSAQASRLQSLTPAPVLTLATHPDPATGETEARSLPETPPETRTTPQNAAYVIYTSGSTGKPKGVCVDHRAAMRLFSTTEPLFGFDETDVWTLFHSFAFDFSVWEVFGALVYGGRLVIVPRVVTRDPGAFADLMLREGVTVLNQTPSAFQQLTAHCARQPVPPAFALRHVIFGGEALNRAALAPWFAAYGDRQPKLVNMYGITETTVHVTHLELSADPGRPYDIGVALPDLQIRLLDIALQPVPPGIPGEICVAGPGVARGYLNRADLTADRFVPDPWGAPGSRMYRSGDVARQRADGGFDYVGRADAQVKLRGFRIETGEIEAALAALPGIAAACVRLRGDRLVAWLASGTPQEPLALRMALARDLPDYMLPAAFVVLPDLPLTTNGKVNVAALPDPEPAAAEPDFVPPESAAEQALAAIWAEVLGRDSVGALDNFFASGGDSMRAVTLAARAAEAGLPVTVEAIFRHQTLRGLAGAVGRAAPVVEHLPPADLPAHLETAWPMTRLQLGMLFHGEVAAEAAVYHDVFSFRLNLDWDEPAFRAALAALAARHPVLRSSFDLHGAEGPMQQVHREVALPLAVSDLSGLSEPDAGAAIAADIAAEKARPFVISAPPLLRLMVHLRGAADVQITLGFHHAILDGWSVAAMQVELMQLWQQARAGHIAGLPPLAATPALAAVAEQAALRAPGARAFWAALLEDAEVLRLPPPAPDLPPRRVALRFGPEVLADLRALADRLGLPLRSLLLTAHLKMLALWGGTADVVSGLVTHTRPEARDAEKMLGLFLNTLPLRLRLGQESWQDLARATFAAEVDLAAHRHYPLAAIVEANGHVPPFDVMFNFIHFHVQDALAGMAGADGTPALRGMTAFEATNFALGVHAVLGGDGLVVDFAHDPARLDAGLAGRMAESYGAILQAMLADPAAPHRVAALIPAEDRALLARWNRTETRYPQAGQTLVGIIEDRIAAEGDRIALRFGGESLGFAALNARANRLAHALRARGVGPDSLVGLAVDRSFEMMVAVLAILKAGGAWVPLPPDYPPARLAMILEDAAPVLVLAQPHLADLPGVEVMLIGPEHAPQDMPDHNPEPLAGPGDTAYVIFTSGSTGRPKGVAVPHRAIVNRLLWMAAAYDLGPEDRVLQKTPLGFDVSVWELILPLMTGAVMVIAEPEGHRDPAYLERVIRDEAVTALHFVPPMLEAFLDRAAPHALPSLRCVVCSGQALPRATQAAFHRAHPGVGLHNLYGPTEAAVDVTAWTCAAGDAGDQVPIGHAIANVRMYVLDAALDPVPPGVAGHLYIGGVALARGYVGRPDLTAAAFLPDPFGPPGARMYRTGDLARFRPDGALDYLGRADDQVKIRGFRVEPGEVEAALRAAGADQAVVLTAPGPDGTMRLLAWVAGDAPPDTLRAALARHLPAHMLPEAITPLAALPVTANGKVDRKALPMPEATPTAAHIAPRSPSEATIATIWARLLGQPQVGVTDSFFAIGGHSILALRLLAELQRETGVVLSLRLFLADPTVAGLAVAMDAMTGLTAPPEDDTAETETILL